jgi:hypothetical protein
VVDLAVTDNFQGHLLHHGKRRLVVGFRALLPAVGKSTGSDHRVALYSMLSYIVPKLKLSSDLVQAATPILTKEAQTHEQPTAALASLLSGHVSMLLQPDVDEPLPAETTALIAKEINNAKAGIKRAFCDLTGAVLFEGDTIFLQKKESYLPMPFYLLLKPV